MSAANRRFSGGGDSALAFIPGSAMRFRRKETVQLLKLLGCTAISEKGDSALSYIFQSAMHFLEIATVHFPLFPDPQCIFASGTNKKSLQGYSHIPCRLLLINQNQKYLLKIRTIPCVRKPSGRLKPLPAPQTPHLSTPHLQNPGSQ